MHSFGVLHLFERKLPTVDDGMAGDDTVADDAVADDAVADDAVANDVVADDVVANGSDSDSSICDVSVAMALLIMNLLELFLLVMALLVMAVLLMTKTRMAKKIIWRAETSFLCNLTILYFKQNLSLVVFFHYISVFFLVKLIVNDFFNVFKKKFSS